MNVPHPAFNVARITSVFACNQWFHIKKDSFGLASAIYFHAIREGHFKNFFESFYFENSCSFIDDDGNPVSIRWDAIEAFKSEPIESQE